MTTIDEKFSLNELESELNVALKDKAYKRYIMFATVYSERHNNSEAHFNLLYNQYKFCHPEQFNKAGNYNDIV